MQDSATASWVLINTDVSRLHQMAFDHHGCPADVQRRGFVADNVARFHFANAPSASVWHIWQAASVTLIASDGGTRRELRVRLPGARDDAAGIGQVFAALFCFADEDERGVERFLRDCHECTPGAYQRLVKLTAGRRQDTEICLIREITGDVHLFGADATHETLLGDGDKFAIVGKLRADIDLVIENED